MKALVLALALAGLLAIPGEGTTPIDANPCACELSLQFAAAGDGVDLGEPFLGCACAFGFNNLSYIPAECLPEPSCLFIPLSECSVNFGSIYFQCGLLKVYVAVDHDMETTCGGSVRSMFRCPGTDDIQLGYVLGCALDCTPAPAE